MLGLVVGPSRFGGLNTSFGLGLSITAQHQTFSFIFLLFSVCIAFFPFYLDWIFFLLT